MDYRKYFENTLGIAVPEDFDIHHIDFNRENNSIKNLVAVPRKLHKQFHFYHKLVKSRFDQLYINGIVYCTTFCGIDSNELEINNFIKDYRKYLKVFYDMCSYVNKKENILNNIPTCYIGGKNDG